MPHDMLQSGAAWLDSARHEYMTTPISYRRDNLESSIRATRGRSSFQLVDASGFARELVVRDYIIRDVDLAAFGLPEDGDRIEDDGVVFEVRPVESAPAWEWADSTRTSFRVHTREIES